MLTKKQIEEAIIEWQKRLNILHWTINVQWELIPSDNDAMAQIFIVEGSDWANVRFEHNVLNRDAETVNQWIAHELTHIHLHDLYDIPWRMLDKDNGEVKMVLNFLHNEIEHVVDRLSLAFARAMPLPECLVGGDSGAKTPAIA